jgi:predicted metal-dependent peptidase
MSAEVKIQRAHITLMKHPETAMYTEFFLMGKSSIDKDVPTAYTDGFDKVYGEKFINSLDEKYVRGIVMHETLHIVLKHVIRFKTEFKENRILANMATDFVVNDVINSLNDKNIAVLPEGALYDEFFHNWDTREVYDYLKKNSKTKPKPQFSAPCDSSGDGGEDGDSNEPNSPSDSDDGVTEVEVDVNGKKYTYHEFDEHAFDKVIGEMTPEEIDKLNESIDRTLQSSGVLAGTMGGNLPRNIASLLEPKIDWAEVMREFVTNSMRGSDEYTWRKFNKRMMANDLYMPSQENENIGELIFANDTSGSITDEMITRGATELASVCELVNPSKVRVLWWDTEVHGEQVFEDNYQNISKLLKPMGGGGTRVSCVSQYIKDNNIKAEAIVVFTDGYLETNITWDTSTPTLWVVTENRNFKPPFGKLVKYEI